MTEKRIDWVTLDRPQDFFSPFSNKDDGKRIDWVTLDRPQDFFLSFRLSFTFRERGYENARKEIMKFPAHRDLSIA